jgi:hypothetical protein
MGITVFIDVDVQRTNGFIAERVGRFDGDRVVTAQRILVAGIGRVERPNDGAITPRSTTA